MGYFQDSFAYDRLREVLLDPLSPGGSRRYVSAIYDVIGEQPVDAGERLALDGSVLVFDGVFLHRPELVAYWDCSVFLEVDPQAAAARIANRDGATPDPSGARTLRYVDGQRIYLERCRPRRMATIVVDNTDLDRPRVIR